MIAATAPGRCGLVGNPSDMYGGAVISIATAERARCDLRPAGALTIAAGDRTARIARSHDLEPVRDELDIVRAVLRHFDVLSQGARLDLRVSTEIPMQAGLAGSTALIVCVIGALDAYFGWSLHPWAMAEIAHEVEYAGMGVTCGYQDQNMAVFGGLNYMEFAGKERLGQCDGDPLSVVEPLAPYIAEVPLLVAHTGVKHDSGSVHGTSRERWLEGDKAVVHAYRRIGEIGRLGKRALLDRDWRLLGAMMNENHDLVASVGGSAPQNDRLIEAARIAGAYGAKLAGAGGGGTIVALTDRQDDVTEALKDAGAEWFTVPNAGAGLVLERT